MPTLSYIVSALLVSSGAMYMYLNSSNKIEETKAKIEESKKIEYLSKKTTLKISSTTNSDVNKSMSIVSLDDSKISELVALDNHTNTSDMKLLDHLQKAMEKVILNGSSDKPSCSKLSETGYISLNECNSIKNKEFSFYDTSTQDIKLPKESVLAKDIKQSRKIKRRIISARTNYKLVEKNLIRYKKKVKDNKELEKIILRSNDGEYLTKIASRHMRNAQRNIYNDEIKNSLEQRTKELNIIQKDDKLSKMFDNYDKKENEYSKNISDRLKELKTAENTLKSRIKAIQNNINDIESQISNSDNRGHGMMGGIANSMMDSVSDNLTSLNDKLNASKQKLKRYQKQLNDISKEKANLEKKRG